jgi:hypothetical protein
MFASLTQRVQLSWAIHMAMAVIQVKLLLTLTTV